MTTPPQRDQVGKLQLRALLANFVGWVTVYGAADQPIARCNSNCDLWLPPGIYTVHLRERADSSSSIKFLLTLRKPTTITIAPSDDGTAAAGAVLGIVGPITAVAGIFMTFLGNIINQELFVAGIVAARRGERRSDRRIDSSRPLSSFATRCRAPSCPIHITNTSRGSVCRDGRSRTIGDVEVLSA